jgi:nitrate/TMAO reductase-like tetraheme cytochrome c subunit
MSKVLRFSFVIFALLGFIVWTLAASPPEEVKAEFIGSEACLNCHEEQILTDYQHTVHFGVEANAETELEKNMCEACHGPGSAHAENTEDYSLLLTFNTKKSEESPD